MATNNVLKRMSNFSIDGVAVINKQDKSKRRKLPKLSVEDEDLLSKTINDRT